MKKAILLSGLSLATLNVLAQTTITDTVSMGAGYANNIWYSLENDEQGSAPANNWELALIASGKPANPLTTGIFINPAGSKTMTVYVVPGAGRGDFATIDTAGLSTWTPLYNSDTSWAMGAFNQPSTGMMDYGWGVYDMDDHNIKGDKIFIIQYATGGGMGGGQATYEYRKLYIDLNTKGNKFTIYHDLLDNSDFTTSEIDFSNNQDKNFIYFSLENKQIIDREPASANWDLLFTKYVSSTEPYGATQAYNQVVTGVLQNHGVEVAQANNVDQDDFEDYQSATFSNHINIIGFDWKEMDYQTLGWNIADSVVYFVKTNKKDIWKVVFTGFDGSTSGSFILNKKLLYKAPESSVNDVKGGIASLALYPNPVSNGRVNLVYSFNTQVDKATVTVTDMAGRTIRNESVNTTPGINQYMITTTGLQAGMYLVNLTTDKGTMQQKLIVQ